MAKRLLEPLVRGIPGRAAGLALLCLLAGCSRQTVTTRLVVNTGEATEAQVAETAKLLLARMNHWRPSLTSKVTASVDGRRIHFEFLGETPPPVDLVYLATTQGVYRMASSDAPGIIWISDLDFVSAHCIGEDDQVFLDVQVTPAAATRLLELTRRNVGKVLVVSWDGKVIQRSTIRDAFGQRFRSNLPKDEHFRHMCDILKTGRLPVPIAGYNFESSSTSAHTSLGGG